jgi:hypothetical protein
MSIRPENVTYRFSRVQRVLGLATGPLLRTRFPLCDTQVWPASDIRPLVLEPEPILREQLDHF